MPDYVINELVFSNLSAEDITAIEALTVNEKGNVDFNILVPLPERLRGKWADADMNEVISYWGTKWNAQGNRPFKMVKKPGDGRLILRFLTANNKPSNWIKALIAKTKKPLQYTWCWAGQHGWQSTFVHISSDPIAERKIGSDKALLKRMRKLYKNATASSAQAIQAEAPGSKQLKSEKNAELSSDHAKLIDDFAWEVTKAVTACPHSINDDEVVLRFMPNSEGHNALNQLSRRIKELLTANHKAFDLPSN